MFKRTTHIIAVIVLLDQTDMGFVSDRREMIALSIYRNKHFPPDYLANSSTLQKQKKGQVTEFSRLPIIAFQTGQIGSGFPET